MQFETVSAIHHIPTEVKSIVADQQSTRDFNHGLHAGSISSCCSGSPCLFIPDVWLTFPRTDVRPRVVMGGPAMSCPVLGVCQHVESDRKTPSDDEVVERCLLHNIYTPAWIHSGRGQRQRGNSVVEGLQQTNHRGGEKEVRKYIRWTNIQEAVFI